ncbi:MAG: acyl-CoA dehydrogenase family protein [Porticoccaceae bacterium]|nr:acyl-CoA dehydrogenase family protein [Porticoccaceae bacterium]|tara:strand:- start:3495 stop:4637 length:1143 start_codon:yes stop_codon:yes gene_type:complete
MNFNLPDETKMVQDTVRRFVDSELIPLEQKFPDRLNSTDLPDDVHSKLVEKVEQLGLAAMDAPEEIGGAGLGLLDSCIVTEQVHRSTAGRGAFAMRFAPVLHELGTVEQKDKYLLPMVAGKLQGASAFSEPQAAGDLAGIKTTIEKVDEGWIINGSKCWISYANKADFILVLTRLKGTQRHDGLTWVIVDKGTPGCVIGREQKMIHGQSTYEVFLENCVVSDTQLLGGPGQGWGAGTSFLYTGRLGIAARSLGIADRCLELAIDYAKQRNTFGKPLSSRQAVQWMIADSATELHAARLMVYDAAWRAQQGENVVQQTAMVKSYATEMVSRVVDRAVQIHGAAGLSNETILERCYRDVRPMRIYEGSSEAMRSVVARNLLR